MIIKTYRHKTNRFDALVRYILSDKGRVRDQDFTTQYNMFSSHSIEGVVREFNINLTFLKKRKHRVICYHEIVSFSPQDKPHLQREKLEEVAKKYIQLRGVNALCLSQAHVSNENVHIHFLFSSNEFRSSKTLRLDNRNFREIRIQMEAFQKEKFPELSHSLVYEKWLGYKKEITLPQKHTPDYTIQEVNEKREKILDRDQVEIWIKDLWSEVEDKSNYQELVQHLKRHSELEVYFYREKVNGVKYKGKKYRFRTLDLELEKRKRDHNQKTIHNPER